jgi:hypothetical protein
MVVLVRDIALQFSNWFGSFMNSLRVPGFVRECKYKSTETATTVSVRLSPLYTVISVNGADVYFHRVTGAIDGVGVTQVSDCRMVPVQE